MAAEEAADAVAVKAEAEAEAAWEAKTDAEEVARVAAEADQNSTHKYYILH